MNLHISDRLTCTSAEAIDCFATAGWKGIVNVSQQIDRMVNKDEAVIPCITPSGVFWSMERMRPVSGRGSVTAIIMWNGLCHTQVHQWSYLYIYIYHLYHPARNGKNDFDGLSSPPPIFGPSERAGLHVKMCLRNSRTGRNPTGKLDANCLWSAGATLLKWKRWGLRVSYPILRPFLIFATTQSYILPSFCPCLLGDVSSQCGCCLGAGFQLGGYQFVLQSCHD